jgi:hypothetical protein
MQERWVSLGGSGFWWLQFFFVKIYIYFPMENKGFEFWIFQLETLRNTS